MFFLPPQYHEYSKTTLNSYIGCTHHTLLSKLIAIFAHINHHITTNQIVTINTRQILVDNTKILHITNRKQRIRILENISIQNKQPTLNKISFTTGDGILKCV